MYVYREIHYRYYIDILYICMLYMLYIYFIYIYIYTYIYRSRRHTQARNNCNKY